MQHRPVISSAVDDEREPPSVSLLLVLASFAGGLANLFLVLQQRPGGSWLPLDVAVGALACMALVLRHRRPTTVALTLATASAFAATAGIANYVALFAVARTKRLEIAFLVALADIVAGLVFWLVHPGNASVSLTVMVNTAISLAVVAWGALQQTQQDLVAVYRDRAARIERERAMRAEQIQMAERARIARDMHDSVAHHISLIALYAGGLEVAGASAQDVGPTAGTIRTTATRALDELREVIGMLRDGTLAIPQENGPERSVGGLVDEARRAGQLVVAKLGSGATPDTGSGAEAVYRIVQEGLTNARKHASGALVTVSVHQEGAEAVVSITNPVEAGAPLMPGSGAGLVGLTERVAAAGGVVEHEIVGRGNGGVGEFLLRGRVPLR